MDSMRRMFDRLFEFASGELSHLSTRWRTHTNRRTILAIIFVGVISTTMYVSAIQAPNDFPVGALVSVPSGASLSETAASFEEGGVVQSALALKLIMYFSSLEDDVHAGDYLFQQPENVFVVARAIAQGHYGLEPIRIRIPEGATTREMAAVFGSHLERFDEEQFLLEAEPYEGFLFPDTYFFLPNATDTLVLSTMRQNFDEHLKLIAQEVVAFGKPVRDVVIMASLLEREAHNSEDRRKISGVLWNRLRRDMLLQVDAAFLYTIGKGTFELTNADLTSDDPYNTYVRRGLPPSPIGSPSLDSLLAAVTPTKHEYFFYLADFDHVTHYSKTYEEHLEKKRQYLDS